jgi:hypothetical protein
VPAEPAPAARGTPEDEPVPLALLPELDSSETVTAEGEANTPLPPPAEEDDESS